MSRAARGAGSGTGAKAPGRGASDPKAAVSLARLVEVFASWQGEGLRVGERQVFVRFAVCDKKCRYCDTPESIGAAPPVFRAERTAGARDFEEIRNPVSGTDLDRLVSRLSRDLPRPVVSLTGGEPLLQSGFLARWLADRPGGERFRLETHGLLPDRLAEVAPKVEEVVADLKLPSATGQAVDWDEHLRFVAVARAADPAPALTLKAVVSSGTTPEELERVLECFEAAGPGAGLVLQPVSPWPGGPVPPTMAELLAWQNAGLRRGLEVRVVPQVHRLLGIA